MLENQFVSNSRYLELLDRYFDSTARDQIEKRLLAPGKLGGKTLGLLLAWEILKKESPGIPGASSHIPQSYFIGSDEFVRFVAQCKLPDQLNRATPSSNGQLEKTFAEVPLSEAVMKKVEALLEEVTERPLIVRSSSILEDRYGASFAGIYRSVFCPNQGDRAERLRQMEAAVKQVYASTFSADATSYKKQKGLMEFPEEMAILIQVVEGHIYNNQYFPVASGIAFSENPYCWSDRLNPEDGFLRMVWGLGTQAVQSWPGEYPRLIGLTNPRLRPEKTVNDLFYYSQHHFDAINLKTGALETLPVNPFLIEAYPHVRMVASILDSNGLRGIRSKIDSRDQLVITFDEMINRTAFITMLSQSLKILADKIGGLINIEFSVSLNSDSVIDIGIVQCRRVLWETASDESIMKPDDEKIVVKTNRFLYAGEKRDIEYVVFVDPDLYNSFSRHQQQEIAAIIGRLNQEIGDSGFLLAGPGRWGSFRPDLGVPVKFADIFNAKALLEIHRSREDLLSATYGTHFFLDLVESKIALLAVAVDDACEKVDQGFFRSSDNLVEKYVEDMPCSRDGIRVFRIPFNRKLSIIASPKKRIAYALLV